MEPGSVEHRRAWLAVLRQAAQRIALEAAAQIEQYPAFITAGNEMALDFEHALAVCRAWHYVEGDVLARLTAIDQLLGSMGGSAQSDRWQNVALAADPGWKQARTMAREALRVAGWPLEVPRPET